jgi:hypothetical protein
MNPSRHERRTAASLGRDPQLERTSLAPGLPRCDRDPGAFLPAEVIVVDNGPQGGSIDFLRAEQPDAQVLAFERKHRLRTCRQSRIDRGAERVRRACEQPRGVRPCLVDAHDLSAARRTLKPRRSPARWSPSDPTRLYDAGNVLRHAQNRRAHPPPHEQRHQQRSSFDLRPSWCSSSSTARTDRRAWTPRWSEPLRTLVTPLLPTRPLPDALSKS